MGKGKTRTGGTMDGSAADTLPFPKELTPASLAMLKKMSPLVVEQRYGITYLHSYGQDSPFFAGLTNRVLLGSREPETGYTYATPRGHGMHTGAETEWVRLPDEGTVHAFTVCHFGSEEFLAETPFVLAFVEFEGANTLFLCRLRGVEPEKANLDWIGMRVRARYVRNCKLKPTDVYFVPA